MSSIMDELKTLQGKRRPRPAAEPRVGSAPELARETPGLTLEQGRHRGRLARLWAEQRGPGRLEGDAAEAHPLAVDEPAAPRHLHGVDAESSDVGRDNLLAVAGLHRRGQAVEGWVVGAPGSGSLDLVDLLGVDRLAGGEAHVAAAPPHGMPLLSGHRLEGDLELAIEALGRGKQA